MTVRRGELRTASAVTRQFFKILDDLGVSQAEIAERSDIHMNTLYNWKSGRAGAAVPNLEAALSVLGLELVIQPIRKS